MRKDLFCLAMKLTTKQAAEKLGVTNFRVIALIRDGKLKAEKFANVWMIEEKDLKAVENRTPGRPRKTEKPT
jgi:excisionase family DNA binding protein